MAWTVVRADVPGLADGVARRLLETTDAAQGRIARECGLGTAETLYRVFHRHRRVAPGDYRRGFRTTTPPYATRHGTRNGALTHVAIPLSSRYTALDAVGPYTVPAGRGRSC